MEVKIEILNKRFKTKNVVNNLNLELSGGQIYGFVGPNGSGKSVVMQLIAGFLVPDSGTIYINQVNKKKKRFDTTIGVLFDDTGYLPSLTGLENLYELAKINKNVSVDEIKEYMERFDLNPEDQTAMKDYSLGMKQKVFIIQAIMENQQILLLDEPFNGLDGKAVGVLKSLLRAFKEQGKLVVVSSHHQEDLDDLCDDYILFKEK